MLRAMETVSRPVLVGIILIAAWMLTRVTGFVIRRIVRVALLGQADRATVDHQRAALHLHLAVKAAVHAVVLEHVGQVIGFQQVVDADDFDVVEVLNGSAEHHAPDTAEAVDSNLDCHVCLQGGNFAAIVFGSLAGYECYRNSGNLVTQSGRLHRLFW